MVFFLTQPPPLPNADKPNQKSPSTQTLSQKNREKESNGLLTIYSLKITYSISWPPKQCPSSRPILPKKRSIHNLPARSPSPKLRITPFIGRKTVIKTSKKIATKKMVYSTTLALSPMDLCQDNIYAASESRGCTRTLWIRFCTRSSRSRDGAQSSAIRIKTHPTCRAQGHSSFWSKKTRRVGASKAGETRMINTYGDPMLLDCAIPTWLYPRSSRNFIP